VTSIRVTRSFIAADSLAELIDEEYDLGARVSCKLFSKLLRNQDNDHYLVQAGDKQYVARIYQLGRHLERAESDYLYELDWLRFLRGQGLPVSYPIQRRDGGLLGRLDAPEGPRYYALFSLAVGRPMQRDNQEQLFSLGVNMARIHKASNSFKTEQHRQPMDLAFLVDRPVERLTRFWEHSRVQDLDIILLSAQEAKEELLALLRDEDQAEDSWGPIGGDFHHASVYFADDNHPTFFNFDLCGPGWRAYDIAAFLQNANLFERGEEYAEAFFAGYYSERPLSRGEHAAISPFLTIRRIWLTSIFSQEDGLVGHTFIAPA